MSPALPGVRPVSSGPRAGAQWGEGLSLSLPFSQPSFPRRNGCFWVLFFTGYGGAGRAEPTRPRRPALPVGSGATPGPGQRRPGCVVFLARPQAGAERCQVAAASASGAVGASSGGGEKKASQVIPSNLAAPGPPRSAAESSTTWQEQQAFWAVFLLVTELSGET